MAQRRTWLLVLALGYGGIVGASPPQQIASPPQQADCAGGADLLRERLAHLHSLSASFQQQITAADGHVLQTSAGLLQLARPGRIYWVAEPPYEQTLVADGRSIWVYDPDLEQVTVRDLERQLDNSPAALLVGDSERVLAEFRVCALVEEGVTRLLLRPLATDAIYTQIELDFADARPTAIRMQDSLGQHTRVDLRDVELNPTLDPAVFQFVPPPGVDVFRDD